MRVDIAASSGWADFVFEDDYQLMTIEELEAYITEHKHLPNVPFEAEVAEDGMDLAEMNAVLLRCLAPTIIRMNLYSLIIYKFVRYEQEKNLYQRRKTQYSA